MCFAQSRGGLGQKASGAEAAPHEAQGRGDRAVGNPTPVVKHTGPPPKNALPRIKQDSAPLSEVRPNRWRGASRGFWRVNASWPYSRAARAETVQLGTSCRALGAYLYLIYGRRMGKGV